jgi:group I intron endonuclease
MQYAYNKYGADSFEFMILERCDSQNLDEREEYWVNYYSSNIPEHGYNIRLVATTSKGIKLSAETRRKMSIAHKGQIVTPEHARKSAETRRGQKRTDEQKSRIAMARRKKEEMTVAVVKGLLRNDTLTLQEIATATGVTDRYVSRIKTNSVSWAIGVDATPEHDLPSIPNKEFRQGTTKSISRKRISIETVNLVLRANREDGLGSLRLSKIFGISKSSAEAIIKGKLQWVRDLGVYSEFGL